MVRVRPVDELSQQNQQLDLLGACNDIKSQGLEIGSHVRSPPLLPIQTAPSQESTIRGTLRRTKVCNNAIDLQESLSNTKQMTSDGSVASTKVGSRALCVIARIRVDDDGR